MAPISPAKGLQLQEPQEGNNDTEVQLAILRVSEPIASAAEIADFARSPLKRNSDVSATALDNSTPASLEADLAHYKELFSKLRFSYLEQVTKEKFLRAIVGDPPLVVGHNENTELEAELANVKQELRQRKEEVRMMVEEMEKTGRELARRYKDVSLQTAQLSTLPDSIANFESRIAAMRASQATTADASDPSNTSSSQKLPLPATLSLLTEREAELAALDRQLTTVQATLPRKKREAEVMERELVILERRKEETQAQLQEAKRKKREGESDGLEEMGRWYRGVEASLKHLVNVKG
jgi:DNA repair exonuclease SbcCD ATPase subunit